MRIINQLGAFVVLAICWLPAVYAEAGSNAPDPRQVVEQAANYVIAVLEKQGDEIREDKDQVYNLINEHILPHFDFDRMSYYVLGNVWKNAAEHQQAGFQREFKRLLINTYATALTKFSADEEIVYKDVMLSPKNESVAIVPTEVRQKGAEPVAVAYRMYRTDGAWRIYDVVISGVSLVTNYRANFASQVRSNGLDGLISELSTHNQPENTVTVKQASQVQ